MRTSPLLSFSIALSAVVLVAAPGCFNDTKDATPYKPDAGQDSGAALNFPCGQAGALCAGNEYCEYKTSGTCGKPDLAGSCKPRPTNCDNTCPLVCGCDGKAYCNACEARQAGADTASGRGCVPTGGEISAFALYTDPGKVVVFKSDKDRNICVRLTLIHRLGTKFGLNMPNEWGVDDAIISNDVGDCTITVTGVPPTPKGTAPQAVGGGGGVTFSTDTGQGGKFPCKLSDVNLRLAFDRQPDYNWVPNVEELVAKDVTVAGACQ